MSHINICIIKSKSTAGFIFLKKIRGKWSVRLFYMQYMETKCILLQSQIKISALIWNSFHLNIYSWTQLLLYFAVCSVYAMNRLTSCRMNQEMKFEYRRKNLTPNKNTYPGTSLWNHRYLGWEFFLFGCLVGWFGLFFMLCSLINEIFKIFLPKQDGQNKDEFCNIYCQNWSMV